MTLRVRKLEVKSPTMCLLSSFCCLFVLLLFIFAGSFVADSQSKFESALKSVVRNNARQLGPLFSVYYPPCNKFIKSES